MKIKTIFADRLFSFQYDSVFKHQYARKLHEWGDLEYIIDKAFENGINETLVDQFFDEIFYDREIMRRKISTHCESNSLFEIFNCLTNHSTKIEVLESSKMKFYISEQHRLSRLRLYALRVSQKVFIITGGAIKFSQKMQDNPDTLEELSRFEKCKLFLKGKNFHEDDLSPNIFEA